jgi:tetratricopeptide (TPR) repeat protein
VFVAGAMLPEIEAVSGEGEVLDVLSALVEQSLVRQSEVDGEPRFRMLVTIREYALVRLAESGESDDISRRHAAAYLAVAEEARPHFGSDNQKLWLDALEVEHDNMRAALEWTIARGHADEALRLVFALWRFWQRRGHLVEGTHWCERALALPAENVSPLVRMRALEAAGGLVYWRGQFEQSADYYTKALEIAGRLGDPAEEANAAYNLGFAYGVPMSDIPRALELLRGAHAKFLALGDRGGVARASWALGSFLQLGPRGGVAPASLEEALAATAEALVTNRTLGNRFDLAYAQHLHGVILYKLGRFDESRRALGEGVTLFYEDRDISGLALISSDLAELAAAEGDDQRRAILTGIADSFARRSGTGLLDNFESQEGRWLPRGVPAEFRSALERGLAMKEAEAIAYLKDEDISRD